MSQLHACCYWSNCINSIDPKSILIFIQQSDRINPAWSGPGFGLDLQVITAAVIALPFLIIINI